MRGRHPVIATNLSRYFCASVSSNPADRLTEMNAEGLFSSNYS